MTAQGWGWLILAVAVFWVARTISVRLHPHRKCLRCGGAGVHRAVLFLGAYRRCRRCGGSKSRYRAGARR